MTDLLIPTPIPTAETWDEFFDLCTPIEEEN